MGIEFIFYIGLIIGLPVALVLLLYPQKHKSGNKLLGISILFLWYALFMTHMYNFGYILNFPHLSRTANLLAFLITPTFFLFVRFIFYRQTPWKKWDWIILVPFLFYFIDYLPYYLLSAQVKLALIQGQQMALENFKYDEGWLTPVWFEFYLRQFWSLLFLILTIRLLWINRDIANTGVTNNNRKIFAMIRILTILYGISFIPGFAKIFYGNVPWYNLTTQGITVTVTLVSLGFFLMFNPTYFYGFFWEDEIYLHEKNNLQKIDNHIIEEEYRLLFDKIENYITEKKPHLKSGYSINQLGKETGIPVYKISLTINNCFRTNFNQWINKHRIAEFERLIAQGIHEQLTLDAVSSKCGFSNRMTFTSSFKKVKGTTPKSYIKQQKF